MNLKLDVEVDISEDTLYSYVLSGDFINPKTVRRLLGFNNDWLVDRVTEALNAKITSVRKILNNIADELFDTIKGYPDSDGVCFEDKYSSFKDLSNAAQQTLLLIILAEYQREKESGVCVGTYSGNVSNIIAQYNSKYFIKIINDEWVYPR